MPFRIRCSTSELEWVGKSISPYERSSAEFGLPTSYAFVVLFSIPIRKAVSFAPSLPTTLEAGQRWEGTISAPGALVAGSWARVVFGTLAMVGNPPPNTPPTIVWITDHALRLKS